MSRFLRGVLVVVVVVLAGIKQARGTDGIRNGVPDYTVFESEMIGANNPITNVSTDSLGRLMATSGSKLLVFDGSHWSSYVQSTDPGMEPILLYEAIAGPDNRMYCISEKGIHLLEFVGNQEYVLGDIETGEIDPQDSSFAEIRQGFNHGQYVYFFGIDETIRYDTRTMVFELNVLDRQSTSSLLPFRDSIVEYGTSGYMYIHDENGTYEKFDTNRNRLARQETRVVVSWRDSVYLGHDTGLSVLVNGVIKSWDTELDALPTQSISALVPMSDEYMAVLVKSQGVYILNANGFIVQSLDRRMDHRFARADNFLYAGNGVIWASLGESLVRVDFLSPITDISSLLPYATQYPKMFSHNDALHLLSDGKLIEIQYYKGGGLKGFRDVLPNVEDGVIFAASTPEGIVYSDYLGVHVFKQNGTIEQLSSHSGVNVIAKLKTQPMALISAGNDSIELLELVNGKWTFTGQSLPGSYRSYYSVSMSDGSTWLEHGFGRISRVEMRAGKLSIMSFGIEDGLNASWINIWPYRDKAYIARGADVNLLVWNNEIRQLEALSDEFLRPIESIITPTRPSLDSLGNMWIPTLSSSHVILRKSQDGRVVEDLSTLAELRGEAIIKTMAGNEGSMWLLGRDTLLRYDPRFSKETPALKPTQIYQVEQISDHSILYDSRLSVGDKVISIPYSGNSIRLYLTNPNIGYTKSVSHQYLFRGQGEDWSVLPSTNSLFLPNLIEGSYEVLIRSTYDGVVFGDVSSIFFQVLPPLYRTLWAYIGYMLLLAVGMWGLVHFLRARAEMRNRELQELVHERTKGLDRANVDLTQMYEKVKAADEAKGGFLATVSHEMRTPLNAIIGPSQLLLAEGHTDTQGKFLNMINNAGSHLLEFIDDVLEFTSSGNNNRALVVEDFNLRESLEELTRSIEVQGIEKGLSVLCDIDPGVSDYWKGDAKVLNQIVGNLLNNALKFTESGSVSLAVCAEQSESDVRNLIIKVSDTGMGIPDHAKDLIFEPFQQVEKTMTRHFEGAGLGLSICRQLVARMEGTIGFESELDKGSVFWISVPMISIPNVESNDNILKVDFGDAKLQFKRVLVVDDNEANRQFASHVLKTMDCIVELAVNGKQAIEKAFSTKFDLILMDIRMPVMNGLDASSQIRKGGNPNLVTPIIALSAFLSNTQISECEKLGINRCISKPVTLTQLSEAVVDAFAEN